MKYDAVLLLSFGGPEGPADVLPFLDNVLRGRNVPLERKLEVAKNYELFHGVSPLNGQNRVLQKDLEAELRRRGHSLQVYWGNRNWAPYVREAVESMRRDGVKRAVAFATSAYSSYSGCRQYLEDIERARTEVGEGAPVIDKIRTFANRTQFVRILSDRLKEVLNSLSTQEREKTAVVFTAHSLPLSMSASSNYLPELKEVARRVAEMADVADWTLAFQSRSGPPNQPWLEPDLLSVLSNVATNGNRAVVVSPIGFLSDHMEVIFDLDVQARAKAVELGLNFYRTKTPWGHPKYASLIADLIEEALVTAPIPCAPDCCQLPKRP